MTDNVAPARTSLWGVFATWAIAAIVAVAMGIGFEYVEFWPWLVLGFALVVVFALVLQLMQGNPTGFISRVAASVVGALVIMAVTSLVFWIIASLNA